MSYYKILQSKSMAEFEGEVKTSLTYNRFTPVDILDSEFEKPTLSYVNFSIVKVSVDVVYSVIIGRNESVKKTDKDGKVDYEYVTKWEPLSSKDRRFWEKPILIDGINGVNIDKYRLSKVIKDEKSELLKGRSCYLSENDVRSIVCDCENELVSSIKNWLPGNRYKDFNYNSTSSYDITGNYMVPVWVQKFKYNNTNYCVSDFALKSSNKLFDADLPNDENEVNTIVAERTMPCLTVIITSSILFGLSFILWFWNVINYNYWAPAFVKFITIVMLISLGTLIISPIVYAIMKSKIKNSILDERIAEKEKRLKNFLKNLIDNL